MYIDKAITKLCGNSSRSIIMLLATLFLASIIPAFIISAPTHAYSASLNTSSSVVLNTDPNHTTVHTESINVVSDCQAGYNLTISTSGNNKLYKNGDSTVTTGVFNPVNIGYALNDKTNNANTWGYSLINEPGTIGAFNPITSTPAFLRTEEQTRTEAPTIDDTFNLYYGVNIAPDTPAGSYRMANNGTIIYQLTMAESCNDNLEIDFQANSGSDPVSNLPTNADNTLDPTTHSLILSTKRPARSGYIFREWNTETDGTGQQFQPGDSIKIGSGGMSGIVDLYAVWVAECPSGYICYDGNHADAGSMPNQEATNGNSVTLIASNFSRANYGFAGWNTMPDGSGTQYGPNQNITMPSSGGLNLFARWIKPSGTLQAWANPNSLNVGDVIALKDSRDNEVYTVAKLADNNVWLIENLRLVPNTANITAGNTNNPTSAFVAAAPSSSSSTGQCYDDNSTCVDQVNFNTHNLNRTLTPAYNGATNDTYWYSYGVMYNWYTATAGNGTYNMTTGNAAGDLCPAGWHLPTGGSSGEWGILASNMTGGSAAAKAVTIRAYPNNFLWSGDYNPSKDIPDGVGRQGRIWSTTPVSSNIKNAYRMGYNSTEITATTNSWNKWDNFAIRCIYQGGNIPFANTTVSFEGSGITSISFYNEDYGTETATTSSPTVSLALNNPYTVTATMSSGYELSTWATTSTGTLSSTTTNPTTYTITDEATLTATGAIIPSFTTTVTLPEHVTSITFSHPEYQTQTVTTSGDTVSLKRGVAYTITATFEEGYTLNNWQNGANSTIGSSATNPTTFTVTGDTTLTLIAKEAELLTYVLNYDAGTGGTGAPASDEETSYNSSYTFTIDTSSIPTKFGYAFIGYSETSGASTATYVYDSTNNTFTPNTITLTNESPATSTTTTKALYAVYQEDTCPAGYICYFGNGATSGTMTNQPASSNASATLIPSNYARTNYGFAGWLADLGDSSQNIPETVYGPNETITTPSLSSKGLKLYAKWVESVGNMQTWNGCNSLAQGSVTALTDTRDNQTYAVAKLADDNCWVIENFRLDPATAINPISSTNTHNPTAAFITALTAAGGTSLSTNTMCNTNSSACHDQIQYNANSLNRNLTQSYNTDGNDVSWYGYGVYYNWYTATAGNGKYSSTGTSGSGGDGTVDGDLCPINWHLPTGNSTGEYNALNTAINNGSTSSDANWRKYPNNFIWSGDYNNTKRNSSYANGRLWTATAKDNNNTYRVGFKSNEVTASTNVYYKWDGFIMRCMRDESTVEYSDVTVTFPTGIDSITFQNSRYGTETATPQDPTVSIVQDATYTITANESVGYELDEWTVGQNATIGDANNNPTTLIITGDTALTLTSLAIPDYQITVNLDAGSSSVGFYNAKYGIQTVVNQSSNNDGTHTGTVTLYHGVKYVITNSHKTGYQFSSWNTTSKGTLDSATANPTTYTVTDTSTLSVINQEYIGPEPSSDCDEKAPFITYMQDLNSSNKADVLSSMNEDQQYFLVDKRDNKTYCVAKLRDGNIWMTQNLDLDLDSTRTYNSVDTDISSYWIPMRSTYSTGTTTWNGTSSASGETGSTTPESYDPGEMYWNGTQWPRDQASCEAANGTWQYSTCYDAVVLSSNGNAHYHLGNYYNWTAAIATNNSYDYHTTYGQDVDQSICPAGWTLPKTNSSSNGSYQYLIEKYGWVDIDNDGCGTMDTDLWNTPIKFFSSGTWFPGKVFYRPGGSISLWSPISLVATAGEFYTQTQGCIWASNGSDYNVGNSIRCVSRVNSPPPSPSPHTVAINIDPNITSVSFYNAKYGAQTITVNKGTATLLDNIPYTVSVATATGYEFSSWSTTANGTLGSTITNPTTYTVTDDATLSVTSQVAPSYTVTVNMDSGVSSVGFYNADLGTQTATSSNNTVTLYRNVPYTITGSYNTGYKFVNWSTTNGTLGSTTNATTTYAVNSASTLTLTSEQKTGATTLLPGKELNAKMKTLASGTSKRYSDSSSSIKALKMADSLPAGFTSSAANTVSITGSEKPIYIFFDNTNDAGTMYFYTDARDIVMNEDSSSAFRSNSALADIDGIASWDTSNVTRMDEMFYGASSLININALADWNTSGVMYMNAMFFGAAALTDIDALVNWDTSSLTNMNGMFSYDYALTNIDGAINWDTSNVTDMSVMFNETHVLTDVGGVINWNTSNVTNMSSMFKGASSLANIDALANWDTSSVTNMGYMFSYAYALTNIDALAGWDISSVTNMSGFFSEAKALTNINGATNWDTSSVIDMSAMLDSTHALTNIDGVINWDTSNVIDMTSMFYGASGLSSVGALANWDTSSVMDMSYMFSTTNTLTNIDALANWDTSSVTNMSHMFYCVYSLTNIDALSDWDTSSVTDMKSMFDTASKLTDASGADNWDISNVKATAGSYSDSNNNFYRMFRYTGGSSSSIAHPSFTKRSGTWDSDGTFAPRNTTIESSITGTINFDSHISNIKLYGAFPGSSSSTTQTISTSGSTISLTRGNPYRITATLASGYELALWNPGEHGVIPANRITINSRTNDSTEFIPTDDTTLTATSQPIPNDVTTTVNMDSNVKSISFCNDKYNTYSSSTEKYECAVASSNGSTVTLKQDATYRITTTTKSGYEVSSYTATGATITNTTGAHTDFTPSGSSTLTVTSTTNTPTHTVTVNMDSNVSYITFTNPDWPTRVATSNGGTVDLRENTSYTVTAYNKKGYEFSTWTTSANGILGSLTTNPTTYMIIGDATLSATSQVIPSYNVTVNMDSNATSVSFYNASYGTQTATSSSNTVSLRRGVPYIITASYATGYEFSSWSTGLNGTLADATAATTTYTITDTTTLSLTSQLAPPPPPTSCNTPVPNVTYMQDITPATKTTVLASLTEDAPYYLRDSRDNEPYCVSKLQDGNLWLLDNLRLDLTNSTTLTNTTSFNTNASDTSLNYLKNGGGTTTDKYAIAGVVEWTDSPSYTSRPTAKPLIATSGDCSNTTYCANEPSSNKWTKDSTPKNDNSEMVYGAGSGKIGIYYNYCAASAGSYCYGDDSGWGSPSGNATESLCPINWHMPSGGATGEYQALCDAIKGSSCGSDWESSDVNNLQNKLSTSLSGKFDYGVAYEQGENGLYLSSTYYNKYGMHVLGVTSNRTFPQYYYDRLYGLPIRCILSL